MKTAKLLSVLLVGIALVAGCASNPPASGGMGDEYETGYGGSTTRDITPLPSGPNGVISRSNPFGLGTGSGPTAAR